jgi:hypothetical protein
LDASVVAASIRKNSEYFFKGNFCQNLIHLLSDHPVRLIHEVNFSLILPNRQNPKTADLGNMNDLAFSPAFSDPEIQLNFRNCRVEHFPNAA